MTPHPPERHPLDRLFALATGDLDAAEQARVSEHLRACPSCRDVFAEVSAMHEVLSSLPPVDHESDLGARVRARVTRETRGDRRRWWRTAAAAALLVVISGAGGWMASRWHMRLVTVVHRPAGTAFALVLERDYGVWRETPRDMQVRWTMEFGRWLGSRQLRAHSLGGISLRGETGLMLPARSTTSDVPEPTASATSMTSVGMVVVQVSTYDEAAAIAASCPLLAQGGRVLIRRMY